MMRLSLLAGLAAVMIPAGAPAQTVVGDEGFRALFNPAPVLLELSTECRLFEIYMAINREQKSRGLMFVREMRDDQGMLFVYPEGSRISMWMKNTVIPLDIIFLDADGTIINIARETTPYSLESVRSARPGAFALELNAGAGARLGLESGQALFRADFLSF